MIMFGSAEWESKMVKVKDLAKREETAVPFDSLLAP